jgi:hypothetical protein
MAYAKQKRKKAQVRGKTFFPGLSGLKRKIDSVIEPITDRGLTGPSVRTPEDVRDRLSKREAKLARRAEAARKAGLL